jgi:hypothetical protein
MTVAAIRQELREVRALLGTLPVVPPEPQLAPAALPQQPPAREAGSLAFAPLRAGTPVVILEDGGYSGSTALGG